MPSAMHLVPHAKRSPAQQVGVDVALQGQKALIQNPMIGIPVFWGIFLGGLVWYVTGLMGYAAAPLIGLGAGFVIGSLAYWDGVGSGWVDTPAAGGA